MNGVIQCYSKGAASCLAYQLVLPVFAWYKSSIVISTVFTEAEDDGEIVVVLFVIRNQECQLVGQDR